MPNPHPVTAGNVNWRLAMLKAQFSKGRTNRRRCIATKRDGTPCGMLAMTRYRAVGLRRPWRLRRGRSDEEAEGYGAM